VTTLTGGGTNLYTGVIRNRGTMVVSGDWNNNGIYGDQANSA